MKRREFITLIGGAAATWPVIARAQQPAIRVIGYLGIGTAESRTLADIRGGLSETGYVEGRNLAIKYRWAEYHLDRMPSPLT